MSTGNMNLTLKIWRQKNTKAKGNLVDYKVADISPDMSFLEMFDVLNEELITKGEEPIVFDHDCREGICGAVQCIINGRPHGPKEALLLASCTCVRLKMVIPLWLNHGEQKHFR